MSNQMHATDDALELYSLGRLKEPHVSELEEHLLLCGECQERLAQEDRCTGALRRALAKKSAEETEPRRALPVVNWRWPSLALLSTAAVAALLIMMFAARSPGPAQELTLLAQRGPEAAAARAAAHTPLNLHVDTTEIGSLPSYRMELVDASGRQVWSGTVRTAANSLTAGVNRSLAPGQYWVRVFGPAPDPLREFALRVE
jgi:hypothetical protein